MRRIAVTAACLAVIGLASSATAGYISISISPEVSIEEGMLNAEVRILNSGDEAAYFLTPALRFRGQERRGTTYSVIGPSLPLNETLEIPAEGVGEGRWPYQVVVDYTDAAQYPFQALFVSTLQVGVPPPAQVTISKFETQTIFRAGELEVSLRNASVEERTVNLRILVPEGLDVAEPESEIVLGPSEEETVSFPLTNRTGIEGSSYPVYVIAEYEEGSFHQARVANSIVELAASEPALGSSRGFWIIGAVLGVAVVILIVRGLVRR